jgi:hypothetical protein
MDLSKIPDLEISWDKLADTLQTTGVEFAINVVTAIAVFYFG